MCLAKNINKWIKQPVPKLSLKKKKVPIFDWFCVSSLLFLLRRGGSILFYCCCPVAVVQLPSRVRLFVTPWTAAHQASLSLTISWSLPKFMFIASVMPSSPLILWHPLLLPSIFPSIRDFSNESSVHIRWPKYQNFSFIISLPVNIQGWSPLRLTGLISLLSKGLAEAFSSTIVRRHQFFGILSSLWSKTPAAAAKSLQSCLTLRDPIDGSPTGSTVPGILQARTLEWVAISVSNAWKWKVKAKSLSRVRLLTTPRTTAYQGPPSMGFSRQEYWSGLPYASYICSIRDFHQEVYLTGFSLFSRFYLDLKNKTKTYDVYTIMGQIELWLTFVTYVGDSPGASVVWTSLSLKTAVFSFRDVEIWLGGPRKNNVFLWEGQWGWGRSCLRSFYLPYLELWTLEDLVWILWEGSAG